MQRQNSLYRKHQRKVININSSEVSHKIAPLVESLANKPDVGFWGAGSQGTGVMCIRRGGGVKGFYASSRRLCFVVKTNYALYRTLSQKLKFNRSEEHTELLYCNAGGLVNRIGYEKRSMKN